MIYVLIFFISLTLTIFSLPYAISFLTKLDIVDQPGERKIHTAPIPRMGGIVIFLVTAVVLISFVPDLHKIRLVLTSSSLLLVCGMVDDKRGLDWKKKFILQFAAAAAAVIFLAPMFDMISLFTVAIPAPWSYIVLTVFIVAAVNSINLMDGMDGLVTGFALIVFFMIFWLAYLANNTFLLVMCAALVGSTLGFLKYNAFPARIFLGDTGSLVLGMFIMLAALLITPSYNSGRTLSLTFPLILLGLPLADTFKVMLVRLWNNKSPFLPDRNHFHHVLIGNNIHHKYAVFILQMISIVFILLAYYYMVVSKGYALTLYGIFGLTLLFMKPLVQGLVRSRNFRDNAKVVINRMPGAYISIYKNFLMPLSLFASALLIAFLLPGDSKITTLTTTILIAACSVLFFISHYQFLKNGIFSETYVLINLLIFSAIAGLSSPLLSSLTVSASVSQVIVRFSYLFLFLFIVFFLLTRERLFDRKPAFLSGLDLIILVLIFLMTVVQNFVKAAGLDFMGIHLVIGFGIYLWYKIMLNWKTSFGVYMFYLSFILPIASLLLMLM